MKQFMLRDFDNDSNIKAKSYNTFEEMDSLWYLHSHFMYSALEKE